jgi:PQQ-dependent dehydrogenase (methanol/ethanol family)
MSKGFKGFNRWVRLPALVPGLALALALSTGVVVAQRVVTSEDLANSPGSEWLKHGGDHGETHYSPLDEIDLASIGRLGLAWEWEVTGTAGNLEASPLVHDGIIYATGTWSNVFALDAATGELIWRWDPAIVRGGIGNGGPSVCCGPVNRGLAMWGDKVYVGLLDGRLVALDKNTGQPAWSVQTTPIGQDYSITGAPRVFNDGMVVIGNSGAEYGVRGFVTAYDGETGEQVWRFYTVPGNPADGFENTAMERAAETWSGQWWTLGGGGTVWDGYAYDPEENLLYVGVGNGSPWARDIRSPGGGDNLYLSSIVALDGDTGELAWYYQTTPGDDWDYTAVQPLMLLDLEIDGRERKVIVQAPKNGFFYVIDRVTGAFISAEKFADDVTWATAVDQETGRPIEAPNARFGTTGGAWLSPGPGGAHNWRAMSYNPRTGLVYLPVQNSSFFYSLDAEFEYEQGVFNTGVPFGRGGGDRPERPELRGPGGLVVARDPVTNTEMWRVERNGGNGGTLSTAGDLVFWFGNERIHASNAQTGQILWSGYLGSNGMANPVSYSIDGRQYIAVEVNAGGGGGGGGGGDDDDDDDDDDDGPDRPARMIALALDGEPLTAPAE